MLWINDKLYTFYDHFVERIHERHIELEWVEETLLNPDTIEYSKSTGRYLYDKLLKSQKTLRVAVDEELEMIVTAHFVDS